jgi:branched-chain amino acid aminotransferase
MLLAQHENSRRVQLSLANLFRTSIALHNGQWMQLGCVSWSVSDFASTHAAIVVERLRTIGGKLFAVDAHHERMIQGLRLLGIPQPNAICEELFNQVLGELLQRNRDLVTACGDVGVVLLVSPGDPGIDGSEEISPSICAHLMPIPWARVASWYQTGCHLRTVEPRNIPKDCLPTQLKSRNRLHYYLADNEAKKLQPGSVGLLLDVDGSVSETSIASILVVTKDGQVLSPRRDRILSGVSLAFVADLCDRFVGKPIQDAAFTVDEIRNAAEVILVGTTGCLWPAVSLDNSPIGQGRPGPVYELIRDHWIEQVEFDFVGQAITLAAKEQ